MAILITGATGLIGTALGEFLNDRQENWHYLTTSKSKIGTLKGGRGFYWNPGKEEIDKNCLNQVHTIINLAGAPMIQRWTKKAKKHILSSRLNSLSLLYATLKSQKQHSVKNLIAASAIGIYPPSEKILYTEARQNVNPYFEGQVVCQWEQQAANFEKLGIDTSIVRIGLVLSKKGGMLAKIFPAARYGLNPPLGNGKQWMSWIHIDDLTALFYHLYQKKEKGIFNAVAPYPVQNNNFTKALATILNRPVWLPAVPVWFLHLLLGSMAPLLYKGQKVSSEKIKKSGFNFKFSRLSEALKDIVGQK